MRQIPRGHTLLLLCLGLVVFLLGRQRVLLLDIADPLTGFALHRSVRTGRRQQEQIWSKAAYVCRTGKNRGIYLSLKECQALNPNKEIRVFKGRNKQDQAQLYMLAGEVGRSEEVQAKTDPQPTSGFNQVSTAMDVGNRGPLPYATFSGQVHVVRSGHEAIEWQKLKSAAVLGFDTEWYGDENSPVALIQIATAHECWIFQMLEPFGVSAFTKAHLLRILQNPNIIKTGVGIDYDFDRLQTLYPDMKSAGGLLDLRDLEPPNQISHAGLASLTRKYLRLRLSKEVQLSKWDSDRLSQPQIMYAATDAWIGFMLHEKMRNRFSESSSWAMPCEWFAKTEAAPMESSPEPQALKLSDLLRQAS